MLQIYTRKKSENCCQENVQGIQNIPNSVQFLICFFY